MIHRTGIFIWIAAAALLPASWVLADISNTTGSVVFERANQAYDRGDYAEALRQYQELFNRDYFSVETLYNAANAAFRSGSPGEAILLYRRAWYLNPRDADVHANMQLAMQRTGALQPSVNIIDHAARELSHREWNAVLRISYWLVIITFALIVLLPASRRYLKPVAIITSGIAAISLAGWLYWYRWQVSGEAVVMVAKQTALYEPRDKATPFFAVPEGSVVQIEEAFDSWVKVRAGRNAGWLPKTSVTRVYPWIRVPE